MQLLSASLMQAAKVRLALPKKLVKIDWLVKMKLSWEHLYAQQNVYFHLTLLSFFAPVAKSHVTFDQIYPHQILILCGLTSN